MSYDPAQDEEDRREREEMERYYAQVKEAQDAYKAENPDYCKRCNGWGMTSWTEYGQRFEEACEHCVCKGKCPRCGAEGIVLDDEGELTGPCEQCRWFHNEGIQSL